MTIASLSDLCQDLEVTVSQSCSSLSKVRSFPSKILVEGGIIICLGSGRRFGNGFLERVVTGLPLMHIRQEIEVVIKEVYTC